MKIKIANTLLFLSIFLASCESAVESVEYDSAPILESVDPFIGTGGHGHTFPGATVPFGMVQVSPDSRIEGWDGCSGYHYSDSLIYGFSHTHLSGTGVSDYGDILFLPTTARLDGDQGEVSVPFVRNHGAHFNKADEVASPGYYKVLLDEQGITAELTATAHCAVHRYSVPEGKPLQVVLDLGYRDHLVEVFLKANGNTEIEGTRISKAWAERQQVHFVAQFSRPFEWVDAREMDGSRVVGGEEVVFADFFNFEPGDQPLEIRVGVSAVDIEGARKNLEAELGAKGTGFIFNKVREEAEKAWEDQLSVIKVKGGSAKDQRNFYTALYHTHIAPNIYTDVDGRYWGMDRQIHSAEGHRQFTIFSLWDTFRATHPLYTILHPGETREFIETFSRQYQEGGRLPVWELAANETDCMIGYHSVPVIVDAYVKGIGDFDTENMLKAMVASANHRHFGLESYQRRGYIEASDEPESVSKTLEYAYDDWCIAIFAELIGDSETAATFYERAQSYQNLFDPETGFFRARMNGGWQKPFDPREVNFNFTEANAWQYSTFVPQDIAHLIELHGGAEAFTAHLDSLFIAPSQTTGREQADITGLIGQYAHGNEPSHHTAYLYAYTGQPARGASRIRQIMDELYRDQPDGLSGNEDCGQMSAWLVFSAMGFYPVCPGTDQYVFGTPLFPEISIELEEGKVFNIQAKGLSEENIYIQSAFLNGEPLERLYLRHGDIMAGGELVLNMGNDPSTIWWNELPGHPFGGQRALPVPVINSSSLTFYKDLEVEISSAQSNRIVYYTTSQKDTVRGEGQLKVTLSETDTIVAWVTDPDGNSSRQVQSTFYKIDEGRKVASLTEYANQYSADGEQSLVDHLRGGPNFRTGRWQGFREDLEVEVDLGEVRRFRKIAVSCLQDIKSWIWMPKSVAIETSTDGEKWIAHGSVAPSIPSKDYGVFLEEIGIEKEGQARFVRIKAEQFGVCPKWHLGAGGATWIFADEIIIE